MAFPQELFDCILENVIDHPTLANLLSIYDLAVLWQPSFDRELGLLISSVANLTHIYLQFEVTGFISRRDLPDFLTATMRPALQQLQSVTFSDDDGHLPRNVIHMFKASEGSTVCKIEIRDCEGLFLSSTHLPLVIHSHCPNGGLKRRSFIHGYRAH
ncbi:hypothetical protein CPB85DRAFT_1334569 [Mucidula mucida]|nr:hypothetical protein CPB85DRAFT_1334569 [Mucidula mucida]